MLDSRFTVFLVIDKEFDGSNDIRPLTAELLSPQESLELFNDREALVRHREILQSTLALVSEGSSSSDDRK